MRWGANDEALYHGARRPIEGAFIRPTKTPGFPEPTGISMTPNPRIAADFGSTIYPMVARGRYGDADAFMRRARELMARGMPEAEASAQTQREFVEAGYAGVRWGNREVIAFRPEDVRSTLAAFQSEGPNMMAGLAGLGLLASTRQRA